MSPLQNALGEDISLKSKQEEIIALLAGSLRTRIVDANGVGYDENRPLPVDFGGSIEIENLTVEFQSVISTLNSTSVPLGANEVFEGEWEDVLSYAGIVAAIFTDAASAPNGAVVQFSADGEDVLTQRTASLPANFGAYFSIPIEARYFRIRYTNGPVAQTIIEAQVGYQFNPPANPQAPFGSTQTDASVAVITKSGVQGRHPLGYYVPLQVDATGQLKVIGPATAAEISALGLATQAGQTAIETALASVLAELQAKLEPGGTVVIHPDSLAALESISAAITNWPADYPDTDAHATLDTIVTKLTDIFGAVDGLEITAGNIDLSNTTIGLALDEVESLLRQVRDRADFPLPAVQLAALTPPVDFPDAAAIGELEDVNTFLQQIKLQNVSGNDPSQQLARPLLADEEWFGSDWIEVENHGSLMYLYAITPDTEAPATVQLQYSDDGVTVLSSSTLTKELVKQGPLTYAVYLSITNGNYSGRYVRVRLLNGPVAQIATPITFFARNRYPFAGSFAGLNASLNFFSRALLVRSVQAGETPDAEFTNVRLAGTKTLVPAPVPLAADATYTSQWIDTELYPTAKLLAVSDAVSAPNGIEFQWSEVEGGTVRSRELHTLRAGYLASGRLIQSSTRARWLRVVYTNGPVAQTSFFLNLRLNPTPLATDVTLRSTASGTTGQQVVGVAATQIAVPALAGRRSLRLKCMSTSARPMFYGFTPGVTTATGDELVPGEPVDLDIDETVAIYVITSSTSGAGVRCSYTEIA